MTRGQRDLPIEPMDRKMNNRHNDTMTATQRAENDARRDADDGYGYELTTAVVAVADENDAVLMRLADTDFQRRIFGIYDDDIGMADANPSRVFNGYAPDAIAEIAAAWWE